MEEKPFMPSTEYQKPAVERDGMSGVIPPFQTPFYFPADPWIFPLQTTLALLLTSMISFMRTFSQGPANSGTFCPGGLAFATFFVHRPPTPPPTVATPGIKNLSTFIKFDFLVLL
jgi:hypothetical protein